MHGHLEQLYCHDKHCSLEVEQPTDVQPTRITPASCFKPQLTHLALQKQMFSSQVSASSCRKTLFFWSGPKLLAVIRVKLSCNVRHDISCSRRHLPRRSLVLISSTLRPRHLQPRGLRHISDRQLFTICSDPQMESAGLTRAQRLVHHRPQSSWEFRLLICVDDGGV